MKRFFGSLLAAVVLFCSIVFLVGGKSADAAYMGPNSAYTYTIKVNRNLNIMSITRLNSQGQTVLVKRFACSTGSGDWATPPGTYHTFGYYDWKKMVGDVWARYAVSFSTHGKGLLIHSVPYFTKNPADLEYKQYNRLGKAASAGCIRLSVEDAKWVYENCNYGTTVIVYENPNEKLEMPRTLKIPEDSPYRGWDPTDVETPGNPWIWKMETAQECSVWSAPSTEEENRVKVIPEGYDVRIIGIEVPSERGDGKVFYRTIKGNYILKRCLKKVK